MANPEAFRDAGKGQGVCAGGLGKVRTGHCFTWSALTQFPPKSVFTSQARGSVGTM